MRDTKKYVHPFEMERRTFYALHRNVGRSLAASAAIVPRWKNFENFVKDMGRKPVGGRLHRKDENLPYGPGNCVWTTRYKHNPEWLNPDKERVIAAFEMLQSGEPVTKISQKLGMTRSVIYAIKEGRSWRHVTGIENPKLPTMYDRPGRPSTESGPPKVKNRFRDLDDILGR